MGGGGLDPCAPPRQRPLAPEAPWTPAGWDRSPRRPSPRALPPQPVRPRTRSPRIRWLPHCTPPAPVRCGRPGSGFGSASGCCTAASPTPGTGRPAPPRRRTRPAPAAAATNQRAAGAEQAARQAQPIQPLPARRRAAVEMGGRLVRSVKGTAAPIAGGEASVQSYPEESGVGRVRASLPAGLQRFPQLFALITVLALQPSNKWRQNQVLPDSLMRETEAPRARGLPLDKFTQIWF